MRVLQVSESLAVDFGGTAAVCAQLANHLVRAGVSVSALPLGGVNGSRSRWPIDSAVVLAVCEPTGPRWLGYCRGMSAVLDSLPPPDLVHVHGLWRVLYAQAGRYAENSHRPLVISTHGMLYDLALIAGRLRRKGVARWLFQDRLLRSARCLHVTAPDEADQLRRLGFDRPVAIIPWGVDTPSESDTRILTPPDSERRALLYFGRLHPHKGLDVLLRAWSQVCRRFAAWHLVIAGSDFDGYGATLARLASELGVSDSVSFPGPVDGVARERLFGGASLLVLPSARENFGLVIAEALVRGVPVIATQGAPWSRVVDEQCGWWVPVGMEPLVTVLGDALARPPETLWAMGARGRQFARAQFAWETATRAMIDLYHWVLERGPQPSFVSS
jgi:glycosyltransferase involved in cell wall biosynthesis